MFSLVSFILYSTIIFGILGGILYKFIPFIHEGPLAGVVVGISFGGIVVPLIAILFGTTLNIIKTLKTTED